MVDLLDMPLQISLTIMDAAFSKTEMGMQVDYSSVPNPENFNSDALWAYKM